MFGKKPSLEQQLASLTVAIREGLGLAETAEITRESIAARITELQSGPCAERDEISGKLTELQANVRVATGIAGDADVTGAAVTASIEAARTQAAAEAAQNLTALSDAVRAAAHIDAQTPLTADSINAAVTDLVNTAAAKIAAGQGVKPLPTNPPATGASDGDDNPIAAAFARANEEPDPRKAAALFAKARQLVNKKGGPHGDN